MRPAAVLGLAVVLTACSGAATAGSSSCVGPTVAVAPAEGRVGEKVVVSVQWLREGCDDHPGASEERPRTGVPVILVQGDARLPLATVSGSGADFSDRVAVPLPAGLSPGPASLVLGEDGGPSAQVVVLP